MKIDTPQHLLALSRAEQNAPKRLRLLAISHFLEGQNRTQIARHLKVARRSVNVWVERYLSEGLDGLEAKKAKGRCCPLTIQQRQQLSDYIEIQSQQATGGRLTGQSIRQYIEEQFDVSYHPSAIYKLLHLLGFSWITSRSRHPKQSQQAQDEFKKNAN